LELGGGGSAVEPQTQDRHGKNLIAAFDRWPASRLPHVTAEALLHAAREDRSGCAIVRNGKIIAADISAMSQLL